MGISDFFRWTRFPVTAWIRACLRGPANRFPLNFKGNLFADAFRAPPHIGFYEKSAGIKLQNKQVSSCLKSTRPSRGIQGKPDFFSEPPTTGGAQKDWMFFHSPPPTQNHTKTADSVAQKSDFFKGIIKLQNNDFLEFFV